MTTSLLFKNDVGAAREAFVVAAPLILRYDLGFRYADTAALLAALEGRMDTAARMLGYSDAAFAAHADDARDPNEATARGKVMQRLSETQPAADIERWMREGMRLSDEDAYRLALSAGNCRLMQNRRALL